jgi:hypothetical protein
VVVAGMQYVAKRAVKMKAAIAQGFAIAIPYDAEKVRSP